LVIIITTFREREREGETARQTDSRQTDRRMKVGGGGWDSEKPSD